MLARVWVGRSGSQSGQREGFFFKPQLPDWLWAYHTPAKWILWAVFRDVTDGDRKLTSTYLMICRRPASYSPHICMIVLNSENSLVIVCIMVYIFPT